jgi:DNA mismatch repair protein MutH
MLQLYDESNPDSIDQFADRLMNKTLRETTEVKDEDVRNGRGDLGTLTEKFFFKIRPLNNHMPDFPLADLELKVTGIKRLASGTLTVKERLVLSMIDYHAVVNESFATSYLYMKIKLMLILFYLYLPDTSVLDMRFIAKRLWQIPDNDLDLIVEDWQKIAQKIRDGKAHELSEGDTLYLSACTKSASSLSRTSQPFSDIPAKPRAFALKASYLRTLYYEDATKKSTNEDFLKNTPEKPFERIVLDKLGPYEGRPVLELFARFGEDINQGSKDKYAILTNRLLGVKSKKVSEFVKAGINIKTIRLKHNGVPAEDMSFPAFNYYELSSQIWDDSQFKDIVESKFFFIVLQETDQGLMFKKAQFWNMPPIDRLEAERVFDETVKRIKEHHADKLPSKKFSGIAHIRPHGRNSQDTLPAPGGLNVVKKCFWLNASYLARELI